MRLATSAAEYVSIGPESKTFIRSRNNWARSRRLKAGVLAKLSDEALDEFESSMSFNDRSGCLLSARCEKIASELGKELPEFFELFGIDASILGSFYPYRCMGKRGCVRQLGWYCFQTKDQPCNNGE